MRIRSIRALSFISLVGFAPLPAMANDLVQLVRDGLSRGYGSSCSLEMQPVERNGYYPCLDIGPYRFVEEYGRLRAFVISPGQPPFEILVSDAEGTRFSYKGPWETDLSKQVESWHAYEIGGGKQQAAAAMGEATRVGAARDTVSAYLESQQPVVVPAEEPLTPPAASSAPPQVYYIMPPGFPQQQYTQPLTPTSIPGEIPVTGVPSINGIAQPGTLVAPGVVAYPTQ